MNRTQRTLFVVLLLLSVFSFPQAKAKEAVITVNFKESLSVGEPQNIDVTINGVSYALYLVLVFNPGDLEVIENNVDDFNEWMSTYDWGNFDKTQFEEDLHTWSGVDTPLDIACKEGFVTVYDPSDSFVYPYDFTAVCGQPGTFEPGEYNIMVIGVSGQLCVLSMDKFKYNYSFFVIPEVPLGTIMSLIPMLGSFYIMKRKKI